MSKPYIILQLRLAAKQIASEGHDGWGNTCSDAADKIEETLSKLERRTKALECIERWPMNRDPVKAFGLVKHEARRALNDD